MYRISFYANWILRKVEEGILKNEDFQGVKTWHKEAARDRSGPVRWSSLAPGGLVWLH
ncbi:MAG: hypothetical protein JJU28_16545 [Cyclobacteriaceae bacterium]|nr:hypothetical protein [Cyclobacteriaceae bacterium]